MSWRNEGLVISIKGLAGSPLTDPFGLWRGLGVENATDQLKLAGTCRPAIAGHGGAQPQGGLLQVGNAERGSGDHPSYEHCPLSSTSVWADPTFLPADTQVLKAEPNNAIAGGHPCMAARSEGKAALAERASSSMACHDNLFLDDGILFADDLHHDAFLTHDTAPDAQVPDLDLGLDDDTELSEALFHTLGAQAAKPVPCVHSAFAHSAPEGCWLAQGSSPQQSGAMSSRSSADDLCFWPDLPDAIEPYVASTGILALPRFSYPAQETMGSRYDCVDSRAIGQAQEVNDILLPHVPTLPSGAAPLGIRLAPPDTPLPRSGSTRTLATSLSSAAQLQQQQHFQDELLSEEDEDEEEDKDDEADPSFSGEPAARAKSGNRSAKRKLPTKNSDEGNSAACTAVAGAKAAKKAEGTQAPVSARGRTSKPRRFYSLSADSDDDISDGSNRRRKHHNPWSVEETEALVVGVERCGGGKWADIKKLGFAVIAQRSPVDLKDKWRNLMRVALLPCPGSPNRVKIEKRREVPQDLLDRVRILCENGANKPPAPAAAKPGGPARARRA